jgi:hypothetical protein
MSEKPDTVCDVCGKQMIPKFDSSATLYRSYSYVINHWEDDDIYVDDDEGDRLQTCETCETLRQNAPDFVDTLKTLRRSCQEALSGEWDKTDEGFKAMIESIDEVFAKAEVKLS